MPSHLFASRRHPRAVRSDFQRAALLCLILVLAPLPMRNNLCDAGYLAGFVGNTKGDTDPVNHRWTVNFAVLDRLTGPSSVGDEFGTGLAGFDDLWEVGGGSPSFDTGARYLYLYQFVESPTTEDNWFLIAAGIEADPLPEITSYQQWSLFLADDNGNVSTTNDFGTDGIAFSMTPPANIGVTDPHVSGSGDTGSLIGATFTLAPTLFVGEFNSYIHPGEMSGLWGVTSNAPPVFYSAPLGEFRAGATVPIPIPEPSSLVLIGIGAFSLIGWPPVRRWLSRIRCRWIIYACHMAAVFVVVVGVIPPTAKANFVYAHVGDADPATDGFTGIHIFGAPSTFGPIANDLGNPAWSVIGTGQSSQYAYASGPLSASELNDIATQGFTLTMVARAIQGIAPTAIAS